MALVKTPEEVEQLKKSGTLLAEVLEVLETAAIPGVSGLELDRIAEEVIRDHGAIPAFKNYGPQGLPPYPASICFSRNQVVVHGVPTRKDIIQDGDIVSIDCGLELNGWFADAARLIGVGNVSEEDSKIIKASRKALGAGIDKCRIGNRLGDICNTIQTSIALSRYYNVIQFTGHAIGRAMHEPPAVPNYGKPNRGPRLQAGMVFCLEPMLKKTNTKLGILPDKWTVVTLDNSRATHIEHMVLVTDGAPEVLTAQVK